MVSLRKVCESGLSLGSSTCNVCSIHLILAPPKSRLLNSPGCMQDLTFLDPTLSFSPSISTPSPASTTSSLAFLHQSLILYFFPGRGSLVHQTGTLTLGNTKLVSLPGREMQGPQKYRSLSLRYTTPPQECTEKSFPAEEEKNSFKTFHFKFHIPFHVHEFRSRSNCF